MSRSALISLLACIALAFPLVVGRFCFGHFDAFAHNDDFLYARTTEILVEEGRYQHVSQHGQLAASIASHCVWGALVCGPLGFSWNNLHLAVAIGAWVGAVCVYLAARELKGSHSIAFLAAMAMTVGPFYYGMSFTFMTDVTAAVFASLAVFGYVRGVMRQSMGWMLFGAIGASLALWARQTHLCVVAIPTIALVGIAWSERSFRGVIAPLAFACGVPIASLLLYQSGLLLPSDEGRVGIVDVDSYDSTWLRQLVLFAYAGGLLIGLVTLPVAPLVWSGLLSRKVTRGWSVWLGGGLVFVVWGGLFVVSTGRAFLTQATGYIVYNAHLGPILLGDQNDPGRWSDMGDIRWPGIIWQVATVLAIFSLAGLAAKAIDDLMGGWRASSEHAVEENHVRRRWVLIGLLGCSLAAAVGLLAYVEMVYDRYWMLLYPMVFTWLGSQVNLKALMSGSRQRLVWASSFTTASILFAVSFVFVHDFLAWNHERRAQCEAWLAEGLEPKDFDAGNGINGWYRAHEDLETFPRDGDETHFWRGLATHALAIGPREGWHVVDKRRWRSWAIMRDSELFVLERDDAKE
ncbi:MAG: glycosyltransferase family 39 protein [Planctomycetota bacterium]